MNTGTDPYPHPSFPPHIEPGIAHDSGSSGESIAGAATSTVLVQATSFLATIAFAIAAALLLGIGGVWFGSLPVLVCAIACLGMAYLAQLLFTHAEALPALGAWGLLCQCASCVFFIAGLATLALSGS